jgi:hypothetical protein
MAVTTHLIESARVPHSLVCVRQWVAQADKPYCVADVTRRVGFSRGLTREILRDLEAQRLIRRCPHRAVPHFWETTPKGRRAGG